ncbi:MAG: glycosyltransferase, partial [Gaiellaceae bacterium]
MSNLWRPGNRVVVVMQRLEAEKDTLTALDAWRLARMWQDGWSMRVVGSGSQRPELERWVARQGVPGVSFAGWVPDVEEELAEAGLMLASARAEPFGLGVLEAMGTG